MAFIDIMWKTKTKFWTDVPRDFVKIGEIVLAGGSKSQSKTIFIPIHCFSLFVHFANDCRKEILF